MVRAQTLNPIPSVPDVPEGAIDVIQVMQETVFCPMGPGDVPHRFLDAKNLRPAVENYSKFFLVQH